MGNASRARDIEPAGVSGFTMLEMLVVVCVLLLLGALIGLTFSVRTCHPRENTTRLQIDGILSSLWLTNGAIRSV